MSEYPRHPLGALVPAPSQHQCHRLRYYEYPAVPRLGGRAAVGIGVIIVRQDRHDPDAPGFQIHIRPVHRQWLPGSHRCSHHEGDDVLQHRVGVCPGGQPVLTEDRIVGAHQCHQTAHLLPTEYVHIGALARRPGDTQHRVPVQGAKAHRASSGVPQCRHDLAGLGGGLGSELIHMVGERGCC